MKIEEYDMLEHDVVKEPSIEIKSSWAISSKAIPEWTKNGTAVQMVIQKYSYFGETCCRYRLVDSLASMKQTI